MLEIQNITKRFGGIHALNKCSLHVARHSVTGIIGPNGSGKTTLFNVITGFYQADQGNIHFNGTSLQKLKPNRIVAQGLVMGSLLIVAQRWVMLLVLAQDRIVRALLIMALDLVVRAFLIMASRQIMLLVLTNDRVV